jgi:YaiO family outer membrane protein
MLVRRFIYGAICVITFAMLQVVPGPLLAETDDILVQARTLATHQQRPEALDLLSKHLAEHPKDVDARLLLGLILSWEGRYDEARSALGQVLEQSPDYADAILSLINVEFWDDHAERADKLAHAARLLHPENADFLLAEAKALKKLERKAEARALLDGLLVREPDNANAKKMRDELQNEPRNEVRDAPEDWAVGINHSNIWFSDHRSTFQEDRVSLKRVTDFGSVFARFYQADQYSITSRLVELEAYPRIRPGTYAYVAAAFSPDAQLYAHYRVAGDIFQSLPYGFEASAGYRLFRFSSNVNMLTGSVGKYYGNWLYGIRTYVTPDQAGASRSFQISARRYFGDGERYMTFRFGTGASPFEVRSLNEIGILHSESFAFEYNRRFRRHWTANFTTGISQEDRIERNGLRQYYLDGTVYYRF